MKTEDILREIQNFKEKLKEYRALTEGYVEQWKPSDDIDKKLHPSKDDEANYEKLKSELDQKFILFGKDLKDKTQVITSDSETGKIIRERNGIGYILTIADNLRDERLIIYNFNIPDEESYKKVWAIVLHGIEKYIGELKYLDERKEDISKRELELKKKEEEFSIKATELESLKRVYEELVHIKRGLPEIIRSEVAKEIKKQHREIEANTNPNTKSQSNQRKQ